MVHTFPYFHHDSIKWTMGCKSRHPAHQPLNPGGIKGTANPRGQIVIGCVALLAKCQHIWTLVIARAWRWKCPFILQLLHLCPQVVTALAPAMPRPAAAIGPRDRGPPPRRRHATQGVDPTPLLDVPPAITMLLARRVYRARRRIRRFQRSRSAPGDGAPRPRSRPARPTPHRTPARPGPRVQRRAPEE